MWNRRTIGIAAATLLVVGAVAISFRSPESTAPSAPSSGRPIEVAATPVTSRPIEVAAGGYVGSASCRECHADEYQSWHASYHRTMTQTVSEDTAPAAIVDTIVEVEGRLYSFENQGDDYIVELDDPTRHGIRMKRRLVLITGSHHMHVFWYESDFQRTPAMLPILYLIDQDRWIPRRSAFLRAPELAMGLELGRWNQNCCTCHSTHPRQRLNSETHIWDTHVAEFGISCEECHGPAEQHVEFHRERTDSVAESITNPKRLPVSTRSDLCGQCHGISLRSFDEVTVDDFMFNGCGFRPGQSLLEVESLKLLRTATGGPEVFRTWDGKNIQSAAYFWPDGEVRVSGREFNGLIESPCYQQGELGCLSCHQMHERDVSRQDEWREDQLKPGMRSNLACTQCHNDAERYGPQHTHHQLGSSGSDCMNCHMPHTVYGLLKTIRSHRISSPSVSMTLETGRQNACNLCHLDRTLEWTSEHLHQWYGQPRPEIDEQNRTIAASVLHYLKGDAVQRAIQAAAFAWPPRSRSPIHFGCRHCT